MPRYLGRPVASWPSDGSIRGPPSCHEPSLVLSTNTGASVHVTSVAVSPTMGLAAAVRTAFERAMVNDGKIADAVLDLPGMSGRKYRRFINNLIELVSAPRYLEIGVWQGSTFCSAIFENEVTATAIDNWSTFGGRRVEFLENLEKFKGKANTNILEKDFRDIDFRQLGKFNVYFFDGPHSYEDQYDAIVLTKCALTEAFVLIVDDWNREIVRRGTFDGLHDNKYHIDYALEIRTSVDNSHGPVQKIREWAKEWREGQSDWHNGYFIAALRKPI